MEKNKDYEKILVILNEYKQNDNYFLCPICLKTFSKHGIKNHLKYSHFDFIKPKRSAWNKGLTKETNKSLKKAGETYHKRVKEGLIVPSQKGKSAKEETKKKISDGMKKAHKEGRAWNIGKSRWNNKKSYPEEFFSEVIKNEFKDKNVEYEFNFGIYSLDFAWPHLKKVIEIDGDQHYRFDEYIERDKRKDAYLQKMGWEVLRIRWKDLFNNTEIYIKKAKAFIEHDLEYSENNLEKYKKELELKEELKLKKEIDKIHEIALKINILEDSNIDFTKIGWVTKVSKLFDFSHTHVKRWIKKNYPEILDGAYIRKIVK